MAFVAGVSVGVAVMLALRWVEGRYLLWVLTRRPRVRRPDR